MKSLLLIGNKPLKKDYSDEVSKFDIVVRTNRMTNYDKARGKTSLWLADVYDLALPLFRQESVEKFLNSEKALVFEHNKDKTLSYLQEIGYEGEVHYIDFEGIPIRKYVPEHNFDADSCMRLTNAIWMLIYCVENYKDYKIYTLGLGGREYLNTGMHRCHSLIYKSEAKTYESLAIMGKITPIDEKITSLSYC